jgi:hypothetical protein
MVVMVMVMVMVVAVVVGWWMVDGGGGYKVQPLTAGTSMKNPIISALLPAPLYFSRAGEIRIGSPLFKRDDYSAGEARENNNEVA